MSVSTLNETLRLIIEEHSVNYAIYRVNQILEEHKKAAEDRGFIAGWNACLEAMPKKMKAARRKHDGQ